MTSKEKLQRSINTLNYKKSQNEKLSNVDEARLKCYEEVVKDLEILEEMRKYIKPIDYGEKYLNRYALKVGSEIYHIMMKEDFNRWVRWLENEK